MGACPGGGTRGDQMHVYVNYKTPPSQGGHRNHPWGDRPRKVPAPLYRGVSPLTPRGPGRVAREEDGPCLQPSGWGCRRRGRVPPAQRHSEALEATPPGAGDMACTPPGPPGAAMTRRLGGAGGPGGAAGSDPGGRAAEQGSPQGGVSPVWQLEPGDSRPRRADHPERMRLQHPHGSLAAESGVVCAPGTCGSGLPAGAAAPHVVGRMPWKEAEGGPSSHPCRFPAEGCLAEGSCWMTGPTGRPCTPHPPRSGQSQGRQPMAARSGRGPLATGV